MPAAAKTQGRLLPLQPARRPTRCARRGALVPSPKGRARRLVAGGHLPVLDHLPTRLPAAQNRDGEPDLHLHTQHPPATAAGQRRCRRRVRPPRSARGAPLPRLLAALLRNRGAPAAARISAEIAIERLGSSAPAMLPRGAERATSRREKAPECGSSSDSAVAAPIWAHARHCTSVRESPSCGQNASGQLQQASQRHAEAADCGQLVTERRREVISRGSRHAGRGAAGEGDGRRLTCACRALRPWCRGRRRLTSDGRCSGHSVRAQRLRAADLASHATVLSDRRLGSLLGGHEAPPFAAAGPRRVQEGRGADRRSRMEVGRRAAGVLPPTI